jgi:hypothetical protein
VAAAVTVLVVATVLVHAVWLVRLPVAGQVADPALPLVLAVAFRRPAWGPVVGAATGFLQDLLFGGSLGLFTLAKLLVAQGGALLARSVLIDQPLLPWVATAAATVVHQVTVVLVLRVGGLLPLGPTLGAPLLIQVSLNLAAAVPAFALVYRVLRPPLPPMRWRLVSQTAAGAWGREPEAVGRPAERRPAERAATVGRSGARRDGR